MTAQNSHQRGTHVYRMSHEHGFAMTAADAHCETVQQQISAGTRYRNAMVGAGQMRQPHEVDLRNRVAGLMDYMDMNCG